MRKVGANLESNFNLKIKKIKTKNQHLLLFGLICLVSGVFNNIGEDYRTTGIKAGTNRRQHLIPFLTHCSQTEGDIREGEGWAFVTQHLAILCMCSFAVCLYRATHLCSVTPPCVDHSYQALFGVNAPYASLLLSGQLLEKSP